MILGVCPINGDQSLNVKWCPTNKKCYHHCNCNKFHNISVTFFQNIVLLFIYCLLFKKEKLLKNKNIKCSYDGRNNGSSISVPISVNEIYIKNYTFVFLFLSIVSFKKKKIMSFFIVIIKIL